MCCASIIEETAAEAVFCGQLSVIHLFINTYFVLCYISLLSREISMKLGADIHDVSVNRWKDFQGHGVRDQTNAVMTIGDLANSTACELLEGIRIKTYTSTYYARKTNCLIRFSRSWGLRSRSYMCVYRCVNVLMVETNIWTLCCWGSIVKLCTFLQLRFLAVYPMFALLDFLL